VTSPGSDPTPPNLQALRAQLRALGYLDARVDRFVLGSIVAGRKAAALAALAAVRIGLLTGLLLAPAALLGLMARAPNLITGWRDAAVVGLYLTAAFGVAAGLLSVVAIPVAGWLARRTATRPDFPTRASRAAVAAGLLVGALAFVYLAFWWQRAVPPGAVAIQAIALTVAATVSLLLAHVITISVLGYLVALGFSRLPVGSPLSSRTVLVPLAMVAVTGGVVMLSATATDPGPAPAAPPLVVVPTAQRVLTLGIDGLAADELRRTTHPTLATLTARGVGVLGTPPADAALDPAAVWTTIATGQPASRHGVQAIESRQLAGVDGRLNGGSGPSQWTTVTDLLRLTRRTITSGDARRVPTFWEVAARAGLRTAVVHWWATWPATEADGIVVSDRAILRLEQGGALAGEIAPASLYDALRVSMTARTARVAALVQGIADGQSPEDAAALTRSATLDATILTLADDPALGPLDLLAVYLPGLDILRHGGGDTQAIEAYLAFLDRALSATVVAPAAGWTTVILVTEPGRNAPSSSTGGWSVLTRESVAGAQPVQTSDTSVMPTILRVLGVPTAEDLPGLVAEDVLPMSVRTSAERRVSTYGERRVAPATGTTQTLDKEMIERMRSLGYIR
jgi:hypothetical protein